MLLKESAYENVMSPNGGVLHHLVSATEERPWLWAVYVLAVLVPVVVIALVCFGRKSRSPAADYKKTDEVSAPVHYPMLFYRWKVQENIFYDVISETSEHVFQWLQADLPGNGNWIGRNPVGK